MRGYRMMHDEAGADAVVLAGGMGTRLRPVVGDRPKALAPVRGRPFLCFILDQLVCAGIKRAVLCTGYLGEQVREAFGDLYGGVRLAYSREGSPMDTAGALRLAAPLVESEEVFVVNGDSFCETDLGAFRNWFRSNDLAAALVINRMRDASRYGRVEADGDGVVFSFREKAGDGKPGWINSGIYLFNRRVIFEIPENRPVSMEREVLPSLMERSRLYAFRNHGGFLDIGTPESYAAADDFFSASNCRGQ